jgi:hypothetical protein
MGQKVNKQKLQLNKGERELLAKLQESLRLVEAAKLHLAVRSHRRQSKQQDPSLN